MAKTTALTADDERALREQAFGPLEPGSILHDFQMLIDQAAAGEVKVSPTTSTPVEATVARLNGRLHRPLRFSQKRTRLLSHPHLKVLFRCAQGCNFLTTSPDDRTTARIVPAALARWAELNNTERYFALLAESLFSEEPPPDHRGARVDLSLHLMYWKSIPPEGKDIDLSKKARIRYKCDAYSSALFDLFGLVRVGHSPEPLPTWYPVRLEPTRFGTALRKAVESLDTVLLLAGLAGYDFPTNDSLQQIFSTYIPAFQQTMVVEVPLIRREGAYVFRASHGKSWRRVALSHKHTLDSLARTILDAFDFDDDHLYDFQYRDRSGRRVEASHPYAEEELSTDEVELAELPLDPGSDLLFTFDYGDNWKFQVRFEEVRPVKSIKKLPALLESHGQGPEQYPDADWEDDEDEQ
jgi:hypothetical protein